MNIQTIKSDCELAMKIAKELKGQGFYANFWQKGSKSPRVYIKGSGGCNGYLEVEGGEIFGNLTGYGRSGEAGDIARAIAEKHKN